jgi:hypothetical protein
MAGAIMSNKAEAPHDVLPLRWTLASAVGWALIFCAIGHTATPLLKAGADSALQGLGGWTSGRLHDVTSAPSNLNTVVSGFILWILQIPFVLLFAAFTLGLGIVAIACSLLDQVYGFAIVGFVFGLQPGPHVYPLGRLADRLGWVGGFLGISAIQTFAVRGARNRVWAAAPLVIGALAATLAWVMVVPAMREHGMLPGPVARQSIVRYQPTPAWKSVQHHGDWRFELTQVVLAPRRVEATVRCFRVSAQPARLRVDRQTLLESYKPVRPGFMHERQVLTKERLPIRGSDVPSRDIEVLARDYRDVTLYFGRPETPHQRWGLSFYAGTTPKGGLRVPFIFDLPR